jgi:hypothetical protein
MNKLFLSLFLYVTFVSCQDNITFNSPSFQGQKDNFFWRATDCKATVVSGSLIIEGLTYNEKVTLKTNSLAVGTYVLGSSFTTMATYVFLDTDNSVAFSTGLGLGNGHIVITDHDALNKTVSGTFKFNAVNSSSNSQLSKPILNFQSGVFYKVPIQ